MKIAFVNQPIDTIIPPYQTSVGACTYGVACSISKSCNVLVYGLKDKNEDPIRDGVNRRIDFRFLPSTQADRLVIKARNKYSRLVQTTQPVSSSRWWFPQFGRQVAEDLRREACDVIHIQHCSQYVPLIRALNPTAKIILHLHAEWFSQMKLSTLQQRVRDVDLVTTVSEYITEKTRRDFPALADRCQTTYNGIDAGEFSRQKDYEALGRRPEKRILYAGAISPHKGLHVLLDAFKLVLKQYPNVRLDIVGPHGNYPIEETFDMRDRALIKSVARYYEKNRLSLLKDKLLRTCSDAGTYESQLNSKIASGVEGKVSVLGLIPRPELIDCYYNADVFVFPPIWDEGFGIPPVEAMAAGTPVVASRSGAVVETVKDQETGFLVPKNDANALAQNILILLQNDELREQMGRSARRRAREHFTWDRVAQDMYDRYQNLLKPNSDRSIDREQVRVPSPAHAAVRS